MRLTWAAHPSGLHRLGSLAEMITLRTFDLSKGTNENNQTYQQCLHTARKEVIQDERQTLTASVFLWVLPTYCSVQMSRSFFYEAVQLCVFRYKSHLSGRLLVLTSPNQPDLKCRKLRYEFANITCGTPL